MFLQNTKVDLHPAITLFDLPGSGFCTCNLPDPLLFDGHGFTISSGLPPYFFKTAGFSQTMSKTQI